MELGAILTGQKGAGRHPLHHLNDLHRVRVAMLVICNVHMCSHYLVS